MHISVLKNQINFLIKKQINFINNENYFTAIDFTFGAGGHSQIILSNLNLENGKLIGIDRDPVTKIFAEKLKEKYQDQNFQYYNDISSNMKNYINEKDKVYFILGDLGLSQIQLNNPRGFAYKEDSILDMQMGVGSLGKLFTFIQETNVNKIGEILREYGEEPNWYKISLKIYKNRNEINTTFKLKEVILSALKLKPQEENKCLSRCFQAFRIFINDEIEILIKTLKVAYDILEENGLLVIISFHSLEDKIVKMFFKQYLKEIEVIYPSEEEILENKQSRSATLRIGRKILS
jgi:16S rRNA (cytosine1402-N4)-methyltransferase